MLHIKLMGIEKRSNMIANVLPADPPSLPLGSKGQNSFFFSEQCHAAYQIKVNQAWMRQHGNKYFARRPLPPPPPTQGMGSMGKTPSPPLP